MIVNDHRSVIALGALALGILSFVPASAFAADAAATEGTSPAPVAYVTLVRAGVDYTYWTRTRTVAEFLAERELRVPPRADVTPDAASSIVDGMRVVVGTTLPQVAMRPPHRNSRARRNARAHVIAWTSRRFESIAQKVRYRSDATLPVGTTALVDPGRPGLRLATYSYERRAHHRAPVRTLLAARVLRAPHERVIARGVAAYASLARVAEAGFASAVRFAGSAIHMIATAYTAGCYRCSGITASGVRAGFGVIAVDPRVIPLGTKLFIPGYGRAIAGDTGGAILGHRVDLGMNTEDDAIRFGRRAVTVYVLR